MPILSFEKVLKIVSTILQILVGALTAAGYMDNGSSDNSDE